LRPNDIESAYQGQPDDNIVRRVPPCRSSSPKFAPGLHDSPVAPVADEDTILDEVIDLPPEIHDAAWACVREFRLEGDAKIAGLLCFREGATQRSNSPTRHPAISSETSTHDNQPHGSPCS
jgi:hypothetical protein